MVSVIFLFVLQCKRPTTKVSFYLKLIFLFFNRNDLDEDEVAGHHFGCGICGETCNTRDGAKRCFYSHLVHISQ